MVAAVSPGPIAELASAAKPESPQQEVLKQVTSLFLSNAGRLKESQIGAFDGLLVPLIERMDAVTLVSLSEALSTTDLAPGETVRRLALHDDALVAGPVLRNSHRLSEKDLLEIANTLSQQHLLAISCRKSLNEALTDVLMRRGDVNVSNELAKNAGAKFSECGYATLVGRAERDESLTEKLGLRLDLPAILLREILAKATDLVLARFLTAPRPVVQGNTQGGADASAAPAKKIDYTQAQSEVLALNRAGERIYQRGGSALIEDRRKDRGNRAVDRERPAVWADRGVQGRQAELVDNDHDHPQSAWLPAGHTTRIRAS